MIANLFWCSKAKFSGNVSFNKTIGSKAVSHDFTCSIIPDFAHDSCRPHGFRFLLKKIALNLAPWVWHLLVIVYGLISQFIFLERVHANCSWASSDDCYVTHQLWLILPRAIRHCATKNRTVSKLRKCCFSYWEKIRKAAFRRFLYLDFLPRLFSPSLVSCVTLEFDNIKIPIYSLTWHTNTHTADFHVAFWLKWKMWLCPDFFL